MATRRATKQYADEQAFLKDYQENISKSAVTLDASCYRGELADNIKLDLRFSDRSRIGPIQAQVIFRGDDGVVAVRLMDTPPELEQRYLTVQQSFVSEVDAILEKALATGQVVLKTEHDQQVEMLQREVDGLQQQLAILVQKVEQLEQTGVSRRGFQIPKVQGREPIFRGAMTQWMNFLIQIQSNQRTGVALIHVDGIERFALFQQGAIVAWKSDPVIEEETLGQLLLQGGRITDAQLDTALQTLQQSDLRLGKILQSMELLTESEVNGALHSQMMWIFQKVLSIQQGTFEFYAFERLPELYPWTSIYPVVPLYSKLRETGLQRNSQQMVAQLNGVHSQRIQLQPTLTQVRDSIEWTRDELDWIDGLAGGERTVAQSLQAASQKQGELAVMLWALLQMNLIQFVAPAQKVVPIVGRLQEKLKQIQGGTHFDVLEVHWISTKSEIEAKYQLLMSELNVQGHPNVPATLQAKIPEVLSGLYQAYAALLDDNARRTYRASIIESHHIEQAATLLGQQAQQALQSGDRRGGLAAFTKALELQPTEVKWVQGLRAATRR